MCVCVGRGVVDQCHFYFFKKNQNCQFQNFSEHRVSSIFGAVKQGNTQQTWTQWKSGCKEMTPKGKSRREDTNLRKCLASVLGSVIPSLTQIRTVDSLSSLDTWAVLRIL